MALDLSVKQPMLLSPGYFPYNHQENALDLSSNHPYQQWENTDFNQELLVNESRAYHTRPQNVYPTSQPLNLTNRDDCRYKDCFADKDTPLNSNYYGYQTNHSDINMSQEIFGGYHVYNTGPQSFNSELKSSQIKNNETVSPPNESAVFKIPQQQTTIRLKEKTSKLSRFPNTGKQYDFKAANCQNSKPHIVKPCENFNQINNCSRKLDCTQGRTFHTGCENDVENRPPQEMRGKYACEASQKYSHHGNKTWHEIEKDLPNDPRDWDKYNVQNWLHFMKNRHCLNEVNPERFQMNGKALCLMSPSMFTYRVPEGGNFLYVDFKTRLTKVLGNNQSRLLS